LFARPRPAIATGFGPTAIEIVRTLELPFVLEALYVKESMPEKPAAGWYTTWPVEPTALNVPCAGATTILYVSGLAAYSVHMSCTTSGRPDGVLITASRQLGAGTGVIVTLGLVVRLARLIVPRSAGAFEEPPPPAP
jgi:hypothetical protein